MFRGARGARGWMEVVAETASAVRQGLLRLAMRLQRVVQSGRRLDRACKLLGAGVRVTGVYSAGVGRCGLWWELEQESGIANGSRVTAVVG